MTIDLKRQFLVFVDNQRPMKVFMRAFNMTKGEVEENLKKIPAYRATVDTHDKIKSIRKSKMDNVEKLKAIRIAQEELNEKLRG